jgi:hypothetical protein
VGRYHLWQAELAGGTDATLTDLLTIRLLWEEALFLQYRDEIADRWAEVIEAHSAPVTIDVDFAANAILQEAWERAVQRDLAETFAPRRGGDGRPAEAAGGLLHRRAVRGVPPGAGIGRSRHPDHRFRGLLRPDRRAQGVRLGRGRAPVARPPEPRGAFDLRRRRPRGRPAARFQARAKRAWGRFKLAAVSSFAFVEATGPIYAGKLVKDALNMAPNKAPAAPPPGSTPRSTPARWWTRRRRS